MNVDKIRGLLTAGLGTSERSATGDGDRTGERHATGDGHTIGERGASLTQALARRSRWRVPIGATIVIVLVALAGAVAVSAFTPQGANTVIGADGSTSVGSAAGDSAGGADGASAAPTAEGIPIFVHILGAVREPGLYELREGDRAIDAVSAAGGFLAQADLTQLNLARFVGDGEQIVVAVIGAVPPASGSGPAASGMVNINTADATTLETLPRVGPAMSARIIAWRDQHGRFAIIEDLMNVSGIGEKTFDGLKALISI